MLDSNNIDQVFEKVWAQITKERNRRSHLMRQIFYIFPIASRTMC